ncbi:hypothetical protein L596_030150 [Steinernema carpocapsae]|nr:hypothetical protein L596_030150 [Steinernema carpocapsae]
MLPFLCELIFKNVFAVIADHLKKNNILSDTFVVKMFQAIGSYGAALSILGLAFFVDCTKVWLAIFFLALHGTSFSAGVSGSFTSTLSIAPRFAGIISALGMFCGMLGAGISPQVFATVNPYGTPEEWRTVFCICAFVYVSCGTPFVLCGSADLQSWAKPKPKNSVSTVSAKDLETTVSM